jgi:predicted small metal-binding protein
MKKLACKALGKECDFVAVGSTEDEVMEKMMEHVKMDHPDVLEMMNDEMKKKEMMDMMKMKMEDV